MKTVITHGPPKEADAGGPRSAGGGSFEAARTNSTLLRRH